MIGKVLVAADGMQLERIGNDLLAFDGEMLTRLSGSAAVIVEMADGTRSLQQIAHEVSGPESAPTTALLEEVASIAQQLVQRGILIQHASTTARRVRVPAHIGWCEDGDRVVVLDLRDGERHVIDAGGAATWRALVTHQSVDAAADALAQAFDAAEGLASDVGRFTEELLERGLLDAARRAR